MLIRWNLEPHMIRKGWSTAYQLSKEAGISRPAAMRCLDANPLERIDVPTLAKLAVAFRVKPWALLEYVPDE